MSHVTFHLLVTILRYLKYVITTELKISQQEPQCKLYSYLLLLGEHKPCSFSFIQETALPTSLGVMHVYSAAPVSSNSLSSSH